MKLALAVAAFLILTGAAEAQTQTGPAPKIQSVEGVVATITPAEVTLAEPGGAARTIKLQPDWTVIVSKPIAVSDIKPGSYLGATNHAKPDGTGVSVEVHVLPQKGPGLDFLMDAQAGTTMTNGVVGQVTKSEGGDVLEIDYGSGVRKVTVPPGTPVVLNTPSSDRSLVKPGLKVRVSTFTPPGGPTRQIIAVGENGIPVP
ncbi:MAG: hypothetical protein JO127_12735 [Caulobacteraceae bacterium]|nr:hypothetical protein [Caulobacteraceae bacterium]